MKKILSCAALALLVFCPDAFAQSTVLQQGTHVAGHAPMYTPNVSPPSILDSGTAAGGPQGTGLGELGITMRGTGTPPFVNKGNGPFYSNLCDYDAPTNNPTGYHYLCFGPNSNGGGLIAYGAGGLASPLPLNISTPAGLLVNGVPISGGGGGTITGVTAGTGLSGGGTSGNVTISNNGVTALTAGSGISLSGATGNVTVTATGSGGTITGVTAGTNMTGGGTSGTVTLNVPTATNSALGAVRPDNTTITQSSGVLTASSTTIGGQVVSPGGSTTNQGNGSKLQLSTGSTSSGHCVQFDSNGNTTDAGGTCTTGGGGGTVTSGTTGEVTFYAANGTTVSGNSNATLTAGGALTLTGIISSSTGTNLPVVSIAAGTGSVTPWTWTLGSPGTWVNVSTGNTSVVYNTMNILDNSNVANSGFGVGLNVAQVVSTAGLTGGRQAIQGAAYIDATSSSSNANRNYVGGAFVGQAIVNDNGASGTGASPSGCAVHGGNTYCGAVFAMNPVAGLLGSASYWGLLSGAEFNIYNTTDQHLWIKEGMSISNIGPSDVYQGVGYDSAIDISNAGTGGVGWANGILFSSAHGGTPMNATNGRLLGVADSGAVLYGIDFLSQNGGTWTYGGAIRLPNFSPILARNGANSADLDLIYLSSGNQAIIGNGAGAAISGGLKVTGLAAAGCVQADNTGLLSVTGTNCTTAGNVSSVSGSGSGISITPTTGNVVVSNTGVTSLSGSQGISASGTSGNISLTNNAYNGTAFATATWTGTTLGNGTINVASVSHPSTGNYTFNFSTANSTSPFPVLLNASAPGSIAVCAATSYSTSSVSVICINPTTGAAIDIAFGSMEVVGVH